MADNFIKIILDITNKMGLYLDVSYNNHWEGNLEHTIGIPSKKQVKRIIWRGFFFVRPKKQEVAFYAPDKPSINELERIYKLKLRKQYWQKSNPPLPTNTIVLIASLNDLDLGNPKHLDFVKYIINARRVYCGR